MGKVTINGHFQVRKLLVYQAGSMGKKILAGTGLPKSAGPGWQRGLAASGASVVLQWCFSGASWDLMWRNIPWVNHG